MVSPKTVSTPKNIIAIMNTANKEKRDLCQYTIPILLYLLLRHKKVCLATLPIKFVFPSISASAAWIKYIALKRKNPPIHNKQTLNKNKKIIYVLSFKINKSCFEPHHVCLRLFGLSYATLGILSSTA